MWGSQNRPEQKPGPRSVFLGESYFLEKTDQRVPMRVSRAPLTSVTTVSATMPCITRNPPTKVRVCLTRPITCSFVMVVFSPIYPSSLLVRTLARRPDLSVLVPYSLSGKIPQHLQIVQIGLGSAGQGLLDLLPQGCASDLWVLSIRQPAGIEFLAI